MRVTLATLPPFARPASNHTNYWLTVGANDVGGLVYWIARLAGAPN